MNRLLQIALFVVLATTMAACNNADGSIKLSSTTMPYPLGYYVEFASDEVPYYIGEPDFDGDVAITFEYKFKIMHHASQMRYLTFRANMFSDTNKTMGSVKFKKDQDAVKILADAIASPDVDYVTVPCKLIVSADYANHINYAKRMEIEYSDIYIAVDNSNFRVGGKYSSDLRLNRDDTFFAGNATCQFEVKNISDQTISGHPVLNIYDEDRNLLMSLPPHDNMPKYVTILPSQNCNFYFGDNTDVSPELLSKWLNNKIIFELKINTPDFSDKRK